MTSKMMSPKKQASVIFRAEIVDKKGIFGQTLYIERIIEDIQIFGVNMSSIMSFISSSEA